MVSDAGKDVAQVGLRIEAIQGRGLDERVENRKERMGSSTGRVPLFVIRAWAVTRRQSAWWASPAPIPGCTEAVPVMAWTGS